MPATATITSLDLPPGRRIGGKYVVESKLGGGWEGEVYKVTEMRTGIQRAAKFFYPHRNVRDRAVTFYAKKLEHLRRCSIVIQYVHSETVRCQGQSITCLISEFVEGELLSDFIARHPGGRLQPFVALHLIHTLCRGLEEIHSEREYHGDIHDGNVMISRRGIMFDLKLVDFYHWGRATSAHIKDDVADVIRLLYDSVGGRRWYAQQPQVIKAACRGLRRDLLAKQFPTARHLREYLESFDGSIWDDTGSITGHRR